MTAKSRDANHNRRSYLLFSLWVGALFIASLFISFFYINQTMVTSELQRVDKALEAEAKEFQALYEKGGVKGLDREITLRSASAEGWYILQTSTLMSGNLAFQNIKVNGKELGMVPEIDGARYAKIDFTYGTDSGDKASDFSSRAARGLVSPLLKDGKSAGLVWVARDVEATMRAAEKIKKAFFGSAVLALLLSLVSGMILSRISLQRDDRNDRVGLAPSI